jgi:hypothetical protein
VAAVTCGRRLLRLDARTVLMDALLAPRSAAGVRCIASIGPKGLPMPERDGLFHHPLGSSLRQAVANSQYDQLGRHPNVGRSDRFQCRLRWRSRRLRDRRQVVIVVLVSATQSFLFFCHSGFVGDGLAGSNNSVACSLNRGSRTLCFFCFPRLVCLV